jgi:hypothetical protein
MRPGGRKLHRKSHCQTGSRPIAPAELAHRCRAIELDYPAQPFKIKRFSIFSPWRISGILFVIDARTDFNKHNNDPAVELRFIVIVGGGMKELTDGQDYRN